MECYQNEKREVKLFNLNVMVLLAFVLLLNIYNPDKYRAIFIKFYKCLFLYLQSYKLLTLIV